MKIPNGRDRPTYFRALAHVNARAAISFLRRCGPFCVIDHVVDRGRKFFHARARDNDGIAAAMCFLGNPEELAALIFAQFHVEMLAFDLQLPRLNQIIHVCKKRRSLGRFSSKREVDFLAEETRGAKGGE
jgi:hypothetical protein